MSDTPAVTLEFLAQQQAKMLAEMADQRADMDALLTFIQRLDAAIGGLLNEVRALHERVERHGSRPVDAFDPINEQGSQQ